MSEKSLKEAAATLRTAGTGSLDAGLGVTFYGMALTFANGFLREQADAGWGALGVEKPLGAVTPTASAAFQFEIPADRVERWGYAPKGEVWFTFSWFPQDKTPEFTTVLNYDRKQIVLAKLPLSPSYWSKTPAQLWQMWGKALVDRFETEMMKVQASRG